MANTNAPFGLQPTGRNLAGSFALEIEHMTVATADVVYPGDAVNQLADGTIEADSATPGTTLYTGVSLGYKAATIASKTVPVVVDPLAIFIAQASTSLASPADAGLNANLVLTAGDSTILRSKHSIDGTTEAVTSSLDVKLKRLAPIVGNESGNYSIWEVVFNKHRNNPAVAGV
jgi:hypothetical protein